MKFEDLTPDPLRPRDLALLLAASEHVPRQRARDQQADRAGMALRRRLLERLAVLDPEPSELDAALARMIEEIGSPTGPTRAIALTIREEWHAACAAPDWIAYLLSEAAGSIAPELASGVSAPPLADCTTRRLREQHSAETWVPPR